MDFEYGESFGTIFRSLRLTCSEVISLLEVLLDLLHPLHTVLGLQVNLSLLKIVLNDSPCPKTWGLKKSLAYSEGKLLHKVVLDLLQPVQAVLDLQANLRSLKMVPNDSPYPKTWGLKTIQIPSFPGS